MAPGEAPLSILLADLLLFERVGEESSQARCLLRIADQQLASGQRLAAFRACRLGIRAATEGQDRALRGRLYAKLAQILASSQHPRLAVACYDHADSELRLAEERLLSCAAALSASTLLAAHNPEDARGRVLALLDELAAAAAPGLFAEALVLLGELDLDDADSGQALLCAESAEKAAALLKSSPAATALRARIAGLRGAALLGQGRLDEAEPLMETAVQGLRAGQPAALARALAYQGALLSQLQRPSEARARLREALRIRQQARHAPQAAALSLELAESHLENAAELTRHLIGALDWLARLPRASRERAALLGRAQELLNKIPSSLLTERIRQRIAGLG